MKKDREIMHNDKKDSELIAEYYDKYEQKLYRLSYAVLGVSVHFLLHLSRFVPI